MIQVEHISKVFGKFKLFDDFSMEIADGEFVINEGASGCGKTTLLNILGSLEKFDAGRVVVDGIDISQKKNQRKYLQEKVGFLFQNFALVERMTIEENMKLVKNNCRSGVSIDEALTSVGLREKKNQKVYSLSGGEQQRVALARLMIKKCDYVFADGRTGFFPSWKNQRKRQNGNYGNARRSLSAKRQTGDTAVNGKYNGLM